MNKLDLKYLLPVLLAGIFTISLSVVYLQPIGQDVWFHQSIADYWRRGELGMFSPPAMTVNKMPYPPLLHWLLIAVPPLILQILFLPVAVASMMLIYWRRDKLLALLVGATVIGSYAYVDRLIQVNPQAITMILLPLALYSVIRRQDKLLIVVSTLMIWNHGLVAIVCLGGVFLHLLIRRQWKPLLWILVFSTPILISTLYYLPAGLQHFSSKFENLQEAQFWTDPLFTPLYQRLPALGFPLAAYLVLKKREILSDFDKINLMTLGTMALMIIPWSDRFVQFTTIPLAFLIVNWLPRTSWKKKELWQYGIVLCFLLMYATLWLWLVADLFYIKM